MPPQNRTERISMAKPSAYLRHPAELFHPDAVPLRSAAMAWALAACIAICATAPAGAAEITRTDLAVPGLPDTIGFLYKGPVAAGDLLNLQSQISALPPDTAVAVVLESNGGSIGEGIALGKFFYRAKIITIVNRGAGCHSACSIAFLGGRSAKTGKPMRIKSSMGLLGFHQFSIKFDPNKKYTKKDRDDMVLTVQDITAALVEYFKYINEDLTFLPFMLRAPSEQIRLLSSEDAIASGVHVFNEQTKLLIDPSLIRQRVKAD
jgi:hypothetical protein